MNNHYVQYKHLNKGKRDVTAPEGKVLSDYTAKSVYGYMSMSSTVSFYRHCSPPVNASYH